MSKREDEFSPSERNVRDLQERATQNSWLYLAGVGFEFSGMIIGGVVGGVVVDRYLQSTPWGMVGGLLLGAIGAFWHLIQFLNRKN